MLHTYYIEAYSQETETEDRLLVRIDAEPGKGVSFSVCDYITPEDETIDNQLADGELVRADDSLFTGGSAITPTRLTAQHTQDGLYVVFQWGGDEYKTYPFQLPDTSPIPRSA